MADQVIMLDKGKLVFDGKKEDFFNLDFSDLNIDLPYIVELEKGLGFEVYMPEEEFFRSVGEKNENRN